MEFKDYNKLSLGVDCVILSTDIHNQENIRVNASRGMQVLLIKRNIEPYNGMWSIPGGLVDDDKGLLETLNTKLFKKTSIGDIYKEQLKTYGDDIYRDPRGRVVSVAYMAMGDKEQFSEVKTNSYGEVKWFWVYLDANNELVILDTDTYAPVVELAFDHWNILRDALLEVQHNAVHKQYPLKMMPEKFTMKELQDLYEIMVCKPIYSFRRLVCDLVEETEQMSEQRAYRRARLYKRRDT